MPRLLRAEYPDSYGDQIKDTVRARINGREVVVELPNARTLSRNLHTMEQAWLDNLPNLETSIHFGAYKDFLGRLSTHGSRAWTDCPLGPATC